MDILCTAHKMKAGVQLQHQNASTAKDQHPHLRTHPGIIAPSTGTLFHPYVSKSDQGNAPWQGSSHWYAIGKIGNLEGVLETLLYILQVTLGVE